MALATKSSASLPQARIPRRVWHAPNSRARRLWLVVALLLSGCLILLYIAALTTQPFPGPLNDPLRSFGIVTFALVLTTASYSLRRRFARSLPGKVQNWLWMHTWLGCAAILIALLHENFTHILHDACQNAGCLTNAYGGTGALLALFILVLSGSAGRLLDRWQARTIARDADANGVGIVQAIEERLLEQEYAIERLCAGKSEEFKQYCFLSLESGQVNPSAPPLASNEQPDFQSAHLALQSYARLSESLTRQQRAKWLMRTWRTLHIVLAILSLLVITFHATMELLSSVFHVF